MTSPSRSYVEHVAVRVRDIGWHIRFFRECLGMELREVHGDPQSPTQVWTIGGMQLIADPAFSGPEGRLAHLGIMTANVEATLAAVAAFGVRALPRGPNWLELPDGLCLEILAAPPAAIAAALAVNPRA